MDVDDRRPAAQGRGAADQAGLALRVRPHHRPADLADRREGRCRRRTCPARRPRRRSRFPTKPAAVRRAPTSTTNDLIDFTPALRAQALENLKRYRWEQTPFVPPVVRRTSRHARRDQHRQHRRRRQLAGLGLRSRDRHLLHARRRTAVRSDRSASPTPKGFDQVSRISRASRSNRPSRRAGKRNRTTVLRGGGRGRGGAGWRSAGRRRARPQRRLRRRRRGAAAAAPAAAGGGGRWRR